MTGRRVAAAGAAALAGMAAAGAAMCVAELVAALLRAPSLVTALGDQLIRRAPLGVVRAGIATFGHNDKKAVLVAVVVAGLGAGAVIGLAGRRRPRVGAAALSGLGVLGAAAALAEPDTTSLAALATGAVAIAAAGGVYLWLVAVATTPLEPAAAIDPRRRAFLLALAGVAAMSGGAGALGRLVARAARAGGGRAGVVLPQPAQAAAPPPAAAATGAAPLITPNDGFYRIDTALVVPDVDLDRWRLKVGGMVERPFSLTYDQLLDLPMVERYVTVACVSNEVGGDLVGTARWLGVPLGDLLARASPRPGATQLVGRAVDGFTAGFPIGALADGRTALVAVGMNGEPLPLRHGFPARLVVAGLYGYVSATKWLTQLELTTLDGFDAYWARRGWAKQAPIKTQSRIDVPPPYATLPVGLATVAGVAWAPTRGISRVEVRADDGPWQAAELSAPLGDEAWHQWRWAWPAPPGRHVLVVRAFDGAGEPQAAADHPPFPDGATGYHTVAVTVRRS